MNFATKLYNWSENVTFVCVEFCNKIAFNLKEKRKEVLDIGIKTMTQTQQIILAVSLCHNIFGPN